MTTATKQGCASKTDFETWTDFYVFPRMSDDQARDEIRDRQLLSGRGGPGEIFARRPVIRHSVSRTLIMQSGGYDI